MIGYSKETFGCLITDIKDDIADVELSDKDGEKSFMEIPRKDLESCGITLKEGNIFKFILKNFLGWEKIIFKRIVTQSYTAEEIEVKRKYYEEKYGDV